MLNYYTSHNHLARSFNSVLLTIASFLMALSFANAQTCPDPGGGIGNPGISSTGGSNNVTYPAALPSGASGWERNTVGRITASGSVTSTYLPNILTINPTLANGHTGSVVLFFRNLWFGNAPNAELKIFRGTSTSGTLVATINAADSTTYTQTSVSYTGPVTLQFQSPVAGTSGNFDVHLRYWTGDQVFQSGFGRLAAVWTDFMQPNSATFIDDHRSSIANAPYTLNTNPIAIARFDGNRQLISSELAFCMDSPLTNIGYGWYDYPGGTTFTYETDSDINNDGVVDANDPLRTARLGWLMANRTTVPVGNLQGTNWEVHNVLDGWSGAWSTAIPSLPTPAEPTFSISASAGTVAPGSVQTFTVNFDMAGSYAKRLKLVVPSGVTIQSVTGAGVTYSGGYINFGSLPGTATIQATSASAQKAQLQVLYDETGFYNVNNFLIFVPCRGSTFQRFVGFKQGEVTQPHREASATWQSADFDYGDLPNTYATASASNGPSHAITAYNATAHTSSLMLGSQIDSEADGVAGTVANGDNLAGVNDEDAIKQFPVLPLGQTNYSVTVPVTNTTGATATVRGWIDFNRDGTFGVGEEATQTVADGGTSVTLTWPSFTAAATAGTVYARFRIASLASEITSPTGAASSGEVEDYRLFIGVTVAGTVFNDVNSNRIINSGENFTSLPAPMYVYMVNSNVIVDAATVGANGSYLLTAPANGTSTVHLSTQQYAIGTDIGTSAVDHTPPTNWKTTGENAGGNNNATTNDSNADGILSVTVTNVNLVNRNFGIRLLTAGTNGGYDICASDRSVMPLSDFISGQDLGGTWSYVSGSGITFDAVAGTVQLTSSATTSTYRYDLGGSFSIATVRVRQLPVKTQSITICEGQSYCLTNPVGNARVIAPNQTYCHTTGGVYTDTLSLAGQYGCDSIVVTTLTVVPTPNAGTDGATTACTNSTTPINLFSLITGEQTGGTWARTSGTGGTFNAGAGTFTPAVGATTSTFSYTVTGANSCGTDVSVASVTLNACAVQISGTVFNDANGLDGIPANTVDGTPIQSAGGAPLYANLFTAAGTFVASVPVNASGNYSFTVTTGTDYLVTVSATAAVTGSTPAGSVGLPGGWVNTGEFVGPGAGSDPAPNGILAVTVGTSNVTDVNFGLDREPNSNSVTHILPTQPATNTEIILDGTDAPLMNGSDLEDGTYTGNTGTVNNPQGVVITSLPTNGELWYYGFGVPVMVSAADVTNGTLFADPSLFTIILTGTGYTSTSFNYAYVDAAGVIDPTPATYTISWGKPLPVTLVGFDAKLENNIARLSWSTTDEVNSDYFEVQHSLDAKNWTALGKLAAAGESSVKKNYTYDHVNLSNGTHYYRLKMADRDGTFALSTIRSLKLENAARVSLYPNPASNHFFLKDLDPGQVKSVKVFNLAGLVVKEKEGVFSEQGMEINLAEGLYVVQVKKTDGSVEVFKLAVKK